MTWKDLSNLEKVLVTTSTIGVVLNSTISHEPFKYYKEIPLGITMLSTFGLMLAATYRLLIGDPRINKSKRNYRCN